MIIDTHCHYNLEPLWSPTDTTLTATTFSKAQSHGVQAALIPGTDKMSSLRALELSARHPKLWAAVGFHPHEATTLQLETVEQELTDLLRQDTAGRCVAIGETGLDYFRLSQSEAAASKHAQQEVFKAHIRVADKYKLPLSIHVRDSGEDAYHALLTILKETKQSDTPFILHCVSGPLSYITEALTLGAYVSFAGNCTYPSAHAIRDILKHAPQERILIETDAPFLPPQQHRGSSCEPWMIQLTAECVCSLKGISLETLYQQTCTLFPALRTA